MGGVSRLPNVLYYFYNNFYTINHGGTSGEAALHNKMLLSALNLITIADRREKKSGAKDGACVE
jgi:hypothetical protein